MERRIIEIRSRIIVERRNWTQKTLKSRSGAYLYGSMLPNSYTVSKEHETSSMIVRVINVAKKFRTYYKKIDVTAARQHLNVSLG
jgi:hypothetical protein